MDPGQDHLLITGPGQSGDLFADLGGRPAAHPSSRIGNDAVAAELVAAVLHLYICPCMLRRLRHRQGLILLRMIDVDDSILLHALFISLQDFQEILFPVVSDQKIYGAIFAEIRLRRLHIAARSYHQSLGILLFRPVKHLPGFPIRDICDCTGIYDIDVRFFLKGNNLIPGLFQHLLHGLRFICIYLASQIM